MRRAVLISAGVFLLMAGLTFAEGNKEAPGSAASPSGNVVWWSPNWDSPRDAELVKKFQEKNPNIKVDIQQTVGQGLENKILVALQSGSGPDVADVSVSWNLSFAKTGGLLALDSYVKESKLDVSDFFAANWTMSQYDGKQYGIPYRASSDGFIYNRKLFREAGLDPDKPPVTWDDVLAYAQKLTKKVGDRKQFGWGLAGGGETNNFMAWFSTTVWSYGGEYFSPDFKTVTINQPPAVAGATFYNDLLNKYHVVQDSALQDDSTTILPLFANEVIAMYLSGVYAIAPARKQNPNIDMGFGIWPRKAGRDPSTNLGGWNVVIPKASKNPNAAWKLVSFIAEPEGMETLTDTFPARKSATKLPRFQNPDYRTFFENMLYSHPFPIQVANWPQMTGVVQKNVQSMLLGQKTPQQAMDTLADELTKLNK
jgi:multiple sugar transport system substrate-binding protein